MKRIIFFDGICTLCNGFIDFILKKDQKNQFLFCSLQSDFAKQNLSEQYQGLDTIVLLDDNKVYTKSTAVLRIVFQLGAGYSLFSMIASILPLFIRDFIYNLVAKNRYKIFGKKDTCRLPTESEKKLFLG